MKISSFEIYKYPIPIEPFTIATGTMHTAQNLLVRIKTSEGITGTGECSAFPMIVGETLETCFAMARDFATIWKNKDPLQIEERMNELHEYAYGNYTAKSAFDMALYDIAAKNAGLPLYRFLGGTRRDIITDMTIGIDTPETMAEKAAHFAQTGFSTLKIKLGKNPEEDFERIRRIRNRIGKETRLRIDANQGWDFDQAVYALNTLAEYDIEFCEQPMRKWRDGQLPELVKRSPIPIMADESVFTHHDAERILESHSANYINIKFAKSGGIHEAILIDETAQKHHIHCMIGSMLESRLALSANVHFALAHPNLQFFDLDTALLGQLKDPVIGGMHYRGQHIEIEDTPGIGAEVDQIYLNEQECLII